MLHVLKKYFSPFASKNEDLGILQIFKPLYTILALLGLFPCSIEFPQGKHEFTVVSKSTTTNSLCALVTVLTVYVFFVLHVKEIYDSIQNSSQNKGIMANMNYLIELVTAVLFCTTSYVCAFQKKKSYVAMLNEIAHAWADLPYVNRAVILGRLRVKINCVVLGSLVVVLIVLPAVTYMGSGRPWKMVLITLSFNLPEIIQFTVVAFYFVMILKVVALLKNIECHSQMILKSRRSVKTGVKVDSGIPITLLQMRTVYVKALSIKREINASFQAPILLTLGQCFHTLVSEAHFIYHGLAFQQNYTAHDVIVCGCWIMLQLLKIYALAQSGTLLKSEALKIGQTIHNIPASVDEDMKLYVEIQHFSTLMNFQDTEITIYGYFPLEAPLMFNILASAAMYLIILVQFDK